ncbi:MAG TPA: phosphopyruvate hydratase [Candidatus Sulfotelmatobacter sp.]|nr:phosphopyruvate hydratase [Candidatus Sulfotelmatobacter sp.]
MRIVRVHAFQIFDSRGNPTVQADITLEGGLRGSGMVPSGASTGSREALELRDGDARRFRGKSVERAVQNVNTEIARAILGMDALDQASIDQVLIQLDGSANKSRLGANALLAVSLAAASAAANVRGKMLCQSLSGDEGSLLPLPEIQIIGGGAHAGHRTDVQDFMLIAVGARTYLETLEMTFNAYHGAHALLQERGKLRGVADEGGFWPEFSRNEEILAFLVEVIERAGYVPGKDLAISLDIAASDLFDPKTNRYQFASENREFTSEQFCQLMVEWCEKYPVISIEDPMSESDWDGWARIHSALGKKIQLIGDDLFCTNPELIRRGIEAGVANAVLIKLNQIGTVTETLAAIRMTQEAGWRPVISARSGETEDAFISHLAVASNAGQLKVGSFSRSERMAKWNEVIRIQHSLGDRARFIGAEIFRGLERTPEI